MKIVYAPNASSETCGVDFLAHNLNDAQADKLVADLRKHGTEAVAIHQRRPHLAEETPEFCDTCVKTYRAELRAARAAALGA